MIAGDHIRSFSYVPLDILIVSFNTIPSIQTSQNVIAEFPIEIAKKTFADKSKIGEQKWYLTYYFL